MPPPVKKSFWVGERSTEVESLRDVVNPNPHTGRKTGGEGWYETKGTPSFQLCPQGSNSVGLRFAVKE